MSIGVQSRGLGSKAARQITALARARGLEASRTGRDGLSVAGRLARIKIAYSGYQRLERLLEKVKICFVRFGRKGRWIALVPAESLMDLLEAESLVHSPAQQ
jgi:hypothetical protein